MNKKINSLVLISLFLTQYLCSKAKDDIAEIKKLLPGAASLFVIDLKYNDKVKILEFGTGRCSKFKVLDNLLGDGAAWKGYWKSLFSYEKPIFFINKNLPVSHKRFAIPYFKSLGGVSVYNFAELKNNPLFQQLSQEKYTHNNFNSIKNYKGIIVFGKYIPRSARTKFMRFFPQFLFIDKEIGSYFITKMNTSKLFSNDKLNTFRPSWNIYRKKYVPGLTKQIINDLQCQHFVIKPVNSFRGNGVLMVPKKNLHRTIKNVVTKNNHLPTNKYYIHNPKPPQSKSYWKHDRNPYFIVEEFAESKKVTIQGKQYDPTMRVVAAMYQDGGIIKIDYLHAFWKRPLKALNEKGTFRERHISKHAPSLQESLGCIVDKHDFQDVASQLNNCLPDIFWNALIKHYSSH